MKTFKSLSLANSLREKTTNKGTSTTSVSLLYPYRKMAIGKAAAAKWLCTLLCLLTLGVGQAWANNGGFYGMYINYTFNGAEATTVGVEDANNDTKGSQTYNLGTLTTGTFTINAVYLKCWDDWGTNYKSGGGLLGYNNKGGDNQELLSFTRTNKGNNSNNYEWQKTSANLTLASYTDASGSYKFVCWGKTWGTSSDNADNGGSKWGDKYYPTNSNNYTFNYTIAPPAISGFGVSATNALAGSGTSSDPYLVKSGNTLTLTVSGSKEHTDDNSTLKYWLNSGSKQTTSNFSISNITSTSTNSAVVHAQNINNSDNTLVGTESTQTIYYKAVSVRDITVYIYVGGRTDEEIHSVVMNGCKPFVSDKELTTIDIHADNSDAVNKFTRNGNWLTYTFQNVTKVSNITCARTGANIFTGEITDNVYYTYDGTQLSSQCIPAITPTWATEPTDGIISNTMTASVSTTGISPSISWSSSNTEIAEVNNSGVITYKTTGTVTITANISWSSTGDYCAGNTTLTKQITVTSGATVTATLTSPEYVAAGVTDQISLDITSTGASTGWKYRIKQTSGGYQTPDNVDASSNSATWTMTSGSPAARVVLSHLQAQCMLTTSMSTHP